MVMVMQYQPARGNGLERSVRCRDRPGDILVAMPGFRPAGPDRLVEPEGARADLSAAGLGRARSARDPAQRHRSRARRSRYRRPRRARPRRGRYRQSARDHGGVGPAYRGAGTQRDRLAGHAHRCPLPQARRRARPGPIPRQLRPAARDVFLGTEGELAARQRAGLRRRAEQGELLFGTMDSWLVWNLTGSSRHRRHQRQPDHAHEPRDARLGRHAARRDRSPAGHAAGRSSPRRRSTARPASRSVACPSPQRSAISRRHSSGRPVFRRGRPSAPMAPGASCCSTPGTRPVLVRAWTDHHRRLEDRRRACDLRARRLDRRHRRARPVVPRQGGAHRQRSGGRNARPQRR